MRWMRASKSVLHAPDDPGRNELRDSVMGKKEKEEKVRESF